MWGGVAFWFWGEIWPWLFVRFSLASNIRRHDVTNTSHILNYLNAVVIDLFKIKWWENPWHRNLVPYKTLHHLIHKTDKRMILINYDMKALQGRLIGGWDETNLVKSTPAGAVRLQFCGSMTPVTLNVKHKCCWEKSSSLSPILHLGVIFVLSQPLAVCHSNTTTALN